MIAQYRVAACLAGFLLAFSLNCHAVLLVPGGFDTQAAVEGNIGRGSSIFVPTLASYQYSACASCAGVFFPYPEINATGVTQYSPGFSQASGEGMALTNFSGSTITSSATAIPNGLHLSAAFSLDPSYATLEPRFLYQTIVGANAAFSDYLTFTSNEGAFFDIFPTVTNIAQNSGTRINLDFNYSIIPVSGSGEINVISRPSLDCGANVIGPSGPLLCGSSVTGDVRVYVKGTVHAYLTQELTMTFGLSSGVGGILEQSADISGTGYLRIQPAGDLTFSSASGQSYAGPNQAFPGASVPEPATLALLGIGLAGLSFSRRRHPRSAACLSAA